ncbi:MAG: cytochrome c [Verrucomicrobia bacterium]|nr:cytochrome c [Verrucomicrobiota bacterium]
MSASQRPDPGPGRSPLSDDALQAGHEQIIGKQPDEKGQYRLLPLNLLFLFSGLIFLGGTYLGRFSGHFSPKVYNEYGQPPKAGAVAAVAVDPLVLGKNVYAQVCAACHQPTGLGLPPAFPPLAGSEWVSGSEERLIRIVLHGLQGPIKVKGVEYVGAMPAAGPGSGYNLSPEKVAAVLTYIRKEWGGIETPTAAAKVAEVRGKEGNRQPWTAAELEKIP